MLIDTLLNTEKEKISPLPEKKEEEKIEEIENPYEEKEEEKTSQEDPKEMLRKKYAVKWLLIQAENYMNDSLYPLALKDLLKAYEESWKSTEIAEKIGDIYMKMDKFRLAYNYYKKMWTNIDEEKKEKILLALIYDTNIGLEGKRQDIKKELESLKLSEQKNFYYQNALFCIENFHEWKKIFQERFFPENSDKETQEETLIEELKNIKQAIENYRNFQTDDISYKNALIVAAFYKNKLYPVAIELGKQILEEKENYKPILKIIAQSYFDLWNMENTKNYLELYNKISPDESDIIYMLGLINMKLKEFLLSNIFFNHSLELGYEPRIEIKRKLIYNYSELNQKEKMLQEFEYLIKEEDYEQSDLYLALYYFIINDQKDKALELAKYGLQKYMNDANIYGYMARIYKDKNELDKAEETLKKWYEFDWKNALINLNFWQVYVLRWEEKKSVIYFKKAIRNDNNGEFAQEAKEALDLISQKQEEENKTKNDTSQSN